MPHAARHFVKHGGIERAGMSHYTRRYPSHLTLVVRWTRPLARKMNGFMFISGLWKPRFARARLGMDCIVFEVLRLFIDPLTAHTRCLCNLGLTSAVAPIIKLRTSDLNSCSGWRFPLIMCLNSHNFDIVKYVFLLNLKSKYCCDEDTLCGSGGGVCVRVF